MMEARVRRNKKTRAKEGILTGDRMEMVKKEDEVEVEASKNTMKAKEGRKRRLWKNEQNQRVNNKREREWC